MANCLKKFYAKDVDFISLMTDLGTVRQKWTCSVNCALLPPKMRTGSRFLNLFEIVSCSQLMLSSWDSLEKDVQATLSFLVLKKSLVHELFCFCELIKLVSKDLKIKGIGKETLENLKLLWLDFPCC